MGFLSLLTFDLLLIIMSRLTWHLSHYATPIVLEHQKTFKNQSGAILNFTLLDILIVRLADTTRYSAKRPVTKKSPALA
jgi:hypothetical protein